MNKQQELAEQILEKHSLMLSIETGGHFSKHLKIEEPKEYKAIIAAIVEAMDAPVTPISDFDLDDMDRGDLEVAYRKLRDSNSIYCKAVMEKHSQILELQRKLEAMELPATEEALINLLEWAVLNYSPRTLSDGPTYWKSEEGTFDTDQIIEQYFKANQKYAQLFITPALAKEVEALSDSEIASIQLLRALLSGKGLVRDFDGHDNKQKLVCEWYNDKPHFYVSGWGSGFGSAIDRVIGIIETNGKQWRIELQNDERIATQQPMPQRTEAGIKEAAKEAISVPAQQGVGWIPVTESTMPKPEQRVLIYFKNDYGKDWTTIAFHVPKFHKEDDADYDGDSEYNEEKDQYYWPEGWYEWQYDSEVNFHLSYNITHWRPLPSKPAQPLQPSLEEKKRDFLKHLGYGSSDINTDVSSVASHNSTDNNSIQQ